MRDPGQGQNSVFTTTALLPIDPARLDGVLVRRIAAYLIDILLVGALWTAAALMAFGATVLSFGLLGGGFALLGLIPLAYSTLTIGLRGATFGQQLFDLEVRDQSLRRPSVFQALIQTVLFYATVPTTGGLALVAVFFFARRRTLHDLLSGTQLLRRARLGLEVLPHDRAGQR
jgi:uncharacterized RDD family membrane protein YckC